MVTTFYRGGDRTDCAMRRLTSFALTGAAVLLPLTACGEKLSVQCSNVGDIVNASSSQRMAAGGFAEGVGILNKAADDLVALELGDKKLSNLRSHLAASQREIATASVAMEGIAGKDGSVSIGSNTSPEHRVISDKFQASNTRFMTVMNATQAYCQGGTVDAALTDIPAQ